jgi:hypothetical protein
MIDGLKVGNKRTILGWLMSISYANLHMITLCSKL